jgi:enamine deaminase RidA (YjgF/YER057c/UK114 family)
VAVYVPLVVGGDLAYVSGHGPLLPDGSFITGRVGAELDQQDGYAAARQTGLAIFATLRNGLGSLNQVRHVVKVLGMVNCTPEFTQHPAVIDGCSEFLVEVFGPANGVVARSAVGLNSLLSGIAVEIEAIFRIERSRGSAIAPMDELSLTVIGTYAKETLGGLTEP